MILDLVLLTRSRAYAHYTMCASYEYEHCFRIDAGSYLPLH